jgi:23S rRNA (uracil1939-C5)-methyltransferase
MSAPTPLSADQPTEATPCALIGRCGGCPWLGRPLSEQRSTKVQRLVDLLIEASDDFQNRTWSRGREAPILHGVGADGLRDRVDLVLRTRDDGSPTLGLYDLVAPESHLHIDSCPAMSPALAAWHEDFARDLPKIRAGSIRLRVAPDGARGVWLDFAHVDVKALLDDERWLTRLGERAVVEIGQRKKRVIRKADGKLGLGDAELAPWWQTWSRGTPLDVWTAVGSFTQPSHAANAMLIRRLERLLAGDDGRLDGESWLELGAGSGNLTLPLASLGATVTALELDELALAGLARGAEAAGLGPRVTTMRRSFLGAPAEVQTLLSSAKGLVVDPPRSGLGAFLDTLADAPTLPERLVYVSCNAESFARDAARLASFGLGLDQLEGVDQFPQTPHAEWIATFSRSW